MILKSDFPDKFIWGTATASFQIEGADAEDGKKPSIWTTFSHTPGRVRDGSNGDVACDHYHRYIEDVKLIKNLGTDAYRFSISWSRVLPDGNGKPNEKGLDFYDRLVDELLSNSITPFVTLYHWDLPQVLQDRFAGWESREIVDYFSDYSSLMFRRLGDRVQNWITLNEPFCSSHLSYLFGEHAPGMSDVKRSFNVAHNQLMAHGASVQAFRQENINGQIGLTNVSTWMEAASENQQDKMASFLANQFTNDWFYGTPVWGEYPKEAFSYLAENNLAPEIKDGDMELISTPFDFYGVNYYTRNIVRANPQSFMGLENIQGELEKTDMGWEIYPEGLENFLVMAYNNYGKKPIYITENGMAEKDFVENDQVHDPRRTKYLMDHFQATKNAMDKGVDMRGYFVWSLMDNFEWAFGYEKRFGLIYIDYENEQKRIPKDSYYELRKFLK